MSKWLELLRGLVRPLVLLSGWGTLLILVTSMVRKFATPEMALSAFSFLTGALSVLIAWWHKSRDDKHNGVPPTP